MRAGRSVRGVGREAAPVGGGGAGGGGEMGLEKYTMLRKIGEGTYGSAYLVHLREDPQALFVLKKIDIREATAKEKAAAHQEAKLLESLKHPFVLGFRESFDHKGNLCLVTDYCDAGDLYQLLQTKRVHLKEEAIKDWFVQLCLAVQYIHERKILHRDLKTQNIFLTKAGDAVLGDFGIARVFKSQKKEMASTVIGTPYYMSPEIMASKAYDYKSDLWALGCILYEVCSLRHAFDARDMNGLAMKIIRGKFSPIPREYSKELRELVNGLLSKNPTTRPDLKKVLQLEFLQPNVDRALAKVRRFAERLVPSGGAGLGGGAGGRGVQVREHAPLVLPKESRLVPNAQRVDGLNLKERIRLEIENERKVKAAVDYKIENLRKLQKAYRSHAAPPSGACQGRGRGAGGVDDEVGLAEERLMQIHREREEVRRQALRFERQQLAQRRESPKAVALPPPRRQEDACLPPRPRASGEEHLPGPGAGLGAQPARDPSPPPDERWGAGQKGADRGPSGPSRPLNPKEARAARKEAEIRKREEELARARQEYAHERQAAQHKQQQIYAPSGHAPPPQQQVRARPAAAPEPEPERRVQFRQEPSPPQYEHARMEAQAQSEGDHFQGDIGSRLAQLEMQATAHEHRIFYLTQQMEDEDAMARKIRDDQDSYNSPRQARADARGVLRADVMEQGGLHDKLDEIRSFCVEKLGPELYEGVHKFMQAQSADSVPPDLLREFGEEMRKQLGPARLHFFPLVDKVVYLEDLISQ